MVRNQILSKMAGRSIAIRRTTYHSLSLVHRQALEAHLLLLFPTSSSEETVTPTEHPAATRSESMREELQGNSSHGPAETENSNKNDDNEEVRGNSSHDLPERLQEFKDNLVDESVPENRDASSSSHELPSDPRAQVVSGKHSIFTHFPKDRNCDICLRTKITRASCRRRTGAAIHRAERFGDLSTADHIVLGEGCESWNKHRYAEVVQHLATQWIQSYPCKTKTSQETQKSLQWFFEPNWKRKVIYTDNSLEFGKACEDLTWNHCTSTPHRSETTGIAEGAVRRVKEGTSAVLLQSGLDEKWWADSMECYCYLRNIQDLLSDGKTPYERRFGKPFEGPIIPFGSLVEYYPISAKDLSRLHQFGSKVLPGLFLGHALHAVGIWEGDIFVADIEELEKMDASEIHAKGLNAKEVLTPMSGEKFMFPIADGTVKLSGGDQVLRTSTLIRSPRPRRRTRKSSRRIRRIFFNPTSRLIVVWWWS